MPKRASPHSPQGPIVGLACLALALFVGGEAMILARDDVWRVRLARVTGLGSPARITQIVGRGIHRGLDAAGVPRDRVREHVTRKSGPRVRWEVGLPPGASLLQTNYAITRSLAIAGAEVLEGREEVGPKGETRATLLIGLPRRPTHEIVLVRPAATAAEIAAAGGRLALVLYGFGDDAERAAEFLSLPHPFAAALVPGGRTNRALFETARAEQREVVLHLPLEPIHYPQVNPGPGTVLVTMKPGKITSLVDRYLDEAGPVTAIANDMGSLATQDMAVMSAIYGELKRRSLPFLHMQPAAGSVCKQLASDLGVEYETPDEVIDLEPRAKKPGALDARWNRALRRARQRGDLIVMIRATPLTRKWLPGALSSKRLQGVRLVPLSSLLGGSAGA